jgi:choline dehydrogenase-like flavoprotein
MQRRDHQIALSALIGTAPGVASINDEGKLQLRIPPEETTRLRRSLAVAARSLLGAGAGFVVPAADRYARITAAGELGDARLWLTTAYPLGGNALSADPAAGVVDAEFRVHRHSNLFVCDASVLPRSLDVDPQLTVMALARLAARAVSRSARSAGQSRPARGC